MNATTAIGSHDGDAIRTVVELELPWSPGLTVNHAYRSNGRGGRILTDEARAWRDGAVLMVRAASHALEWHAGENVEVALRLYVPNGESRPDADNLCKVVLDAVERGLGINDKWFDVSSRVRVDVRPRLELRLAIAEDEVP